VDIGSDNTRLMRAIDALCIRDEIHWRPDYLAQSAWLEHIPFAFWLVRILKPRTFVELGTHLGVSYGAFCQAVERLALNSRCFAVDTWLGDEHSGEYSEEVFNAVQSLNETRWRRFSSLLRMTFADARQYFADGEVDLLHIDGFHTYESASGDFQLWSKTLSNRGIVLFHDTNVRERNFGIWRLWQELKAKYPHFEFIHGYGLGVLGVGQEIPQQLRRLFDATGDTISTAEIRDLFSAIGETVKIRWKAQEDEAKLYLAESQRITDRNLLIGRAEDEIAMVRNELVAAQKAAEESKIEVTLLRNELVAAQKSTQEKLMLEAQYNALLCSRSWRITRPLRTIATLARNNYNHNRKPEPLRAIRALHSSVSMVISRLRKARRATKLAIKIVRESDNTFSLIRKAKRVLMQEGIDGLRLRLYRLESRNAQNTLLAQDDVSVGQLIAKRFPDIQPYPCYIVPSSRPRVSIITDSIGPSSLFGGVGTALLFGTVLANRLGATLRIVTRREPADSARYAEVIASAGLKLENAFEIAMAPLDGAADLSVTSNEVFLTTSWWTTRATLGVSSPKRIIALVQEDERLFYAQGDDRLRCSETLDHPDIISVINTEILFRHLTTGPDMLKNIARNGIFFEPAFPGMKAKKIYKQNDSVARRLFFYARPNNLRNLFWRGIEALDDAAAEGIFRSANWEMHWVGSDLPEIHLSGGMRPIYHSPMSWSAYQEFIAQMDAGFVLMDTPHPSYPPLDLAAAGAAVLTTIYPGKESLSCYSDNIIMAQNSREALVRGLRKLVDLATDDDARARNVATDNIPRDWAQTLSPVISQIVSNIFQEDN